MAIKNIEEEWTKRSLEHITNNTPYSECKIFFWMEKKRKTIKSPKENNQNKNNQNQRKTVYYLNDLQFVKIH